jgi:DNA polymerase-4
MNSYFATVAQQENPLFRGKPLGVCEHLGGIIIAASIEAKKWGIKTGTPVWEARKIYPKIILTKTQPDKYRFYIKRLLNVAEDYTDKVEQASIDELYADMTKACNIRLPNKNQELEFINPYEEALRIALQIKQRMKTEVGDYLTCSIGIAENKLVAKIASDMKKPDKIVVVTQGQIATSDKLKVTSGTEKDELLNNKQILILSKPDLYSCLKLTDIPGIAKRQEKNLNNLGIRTLLDLKNYPVALLVKKFGINGYHLHKMGQLEGSWRPKVEFGPGLKSIGHMYTLPKEYRKAEFFKPVLYKLCEMVARRLRKQNLMGNVINFFVYGKDYQNFGESKKLGFYVYDGREIFLQAVDIYQRLIAKNQSQTFEYKLIGITVAGLCVQNNQLTLFGTEEKLKRIVGALDKINLKYGDFTICRTPVAKAKNVFQDSVGFGRVKEK